MCGDESPLNGDSVVALNWLLVLAASIKNPSGLVDIPPTSHSDERGEAKVRKNTTAEAPSSVLIHLHYALDIFT